MFKFFIFMWRGPDVTPRQFMEYYETRHAPLGVATLMPPMADYRRNYPLWDARLTAALGGFDVMTEVWHQERGGFDLQAAARRTSPAKEILDADEAHFMDPGRKQMIVVAEKGATADIDPVGGVAKYMRFVRGPAGLDAAAFRDRYERDVVPAIGAGIIGYRRNYALFDDPYSYPAGRAEAALLPPPGDRFDVIEEIWIAGPAGAGFLSDLSAAGTAMGCRAEIMRVAERRLPGAGPLAPLADL